VAEQIVSLVATANTDSCIATEDGEIVYQHIADALRRGDLVRVSFEGVRDITSAFLNTAVGQLYGEFTPEFLRQSMLPPASIEPDDLELLKRVTSRAKEYFSNRGQFSSAEGEAFGDEDD
jgi:hypothetical protein